MKNLIWAFIFLIGSYISLSATTYKALFLGNSYTNVNNLPQLVSDVALSFGDTLIHDKNTPGGYQLNQHVTNTTTLSKIAAEEWDFVAIQEQSQLPSFSPGQVATDVFPFASQLVDIIRDNSDCTKPIFYMTWGRQNGDASNCAAYPPVCTYEGMQERLTDSYLQMGDMNDAFVAPVGEAWRVTREMTADAINLYSGDGSHPSIHGSYLAACVFYASMFQKTPVGAWHPTNISEEDAATLQNIAATTVLDNFESWFIPTPAPNPCSYILSIENNGAEQIAENEFQVFPIPARQKLFFRTALHELLTLKLFDSVGKLVLQQSAFSTNETTQTIDVAHLPSGTYFLNIQAQQQHFVKKLVLIE